MEWHITVVSAQHSHGLSQNVPSLADSLVVLVHARCGEELIDSLHGIQARDPYPQVVIESVLELRVQHARGFEGRAADERCWLAYKTFPAEQLGIVRTRRVSTQGSGFAVNPTPITIDDG